MLDLSLQQLLLRVAAFLPIAWLYGVVSARVALALGDSGPRDDGRGGWNPMHEVGVVGLFAAIVTGMGWPRPLVLNERPGASNVGRAAAIVGSGLAGVLVVAGVIVYGRHALFDLAPREGRQAVLLMTQALVTTGLGFVSLNVLPIPPLAGGHIVEAIVRPNARHRDLVRRIGGLATLALLVTGGDAFIVDPLARALASWFGVGGAGP